LVLATSLTINGTRNVPTLRASSLRYWATRPPFQAARGGAGEGQGGVHYSRPKDSNAPASTVQHKRCQRGMTICAL